MRRRGAAFGLAVVTAIAHIGAAGEAFADGRAPGANEASAASTTIATAASATATDRGEALAAAAARHAGLDAYRNAVQRRATEASAALAEARDGLLEGASNEEADRTLEGDLAKALRLPTADHRLLEARLDLALAARDAERDAALRWSAYVEASRQADAWEAAARSLSASADAIAASARFGLATDAERREAAEAYEVARAEADDAGRAAALALRGLEAAYGDAGTALARFRERAPDADLRIGEIDVETLVRSAVESDPEGRKLRSATALAEERYRTAWALYRAFFGADALRPLETALAARPVDYRLTLAVYDAFLADVEGEDALRPDDAPRSRTSYLGERRYALPEALLDWAAAASQERERRKSVTERIRELYARAVDDEAAARRAKEAEAEAEEALRTAVAMKAAGLADEAAVARAQTERARAKAASEAAHGAYFRAAAELGDAAGGALARRLNGDASAPLVAPPAAPEGGSAAPDVAYDPALAAELAAAAERMQRQAAATAATPESAAKETPPDSPSPEDQGSDDRPPAAPEGAPIAVLLTAYDRTAGAAELAERSGETVLAAMLREKRDAAEAAVMAALFEAPASDPVEGENASEGEAPPAERPNSREAAFAAFVPYLETGLFPAVEREWLDEWAAFARSAYDEAAWQALAARTAAPPWTSPDGQAATPLAPDAVAFAAAPVRLDAPPVSVGGAAFVPLRPYAEALGLRAAWHGADRTAAVIGEEGVELTVRIDAAVVERAGGRTATMDAPARSFGGHAYVPLSFFTEALGMQVYWSETLRRGVVFGAAGAARERSESFS